MRRGAAAEAGQHLRRALGQLWVFFLFQNITNGRRGWGGVPTRVPPAPAPATPTAADSGTSSAKWWSSFRRELPSAGSPRGGVTCGESEARALQVAPGRTGSLTHPQPHTGVRIRPTPTCLNVNVQQVQPGMGQWAPAAELGPSKAHASPRRARPLACISVSQQFTPDFGNSSPKVQNRAVKTRKVDLLRPNARCAANRVGRRASTLRHIYFITIKDGEWVGGYPCGQASSRTSAEKAHSLHLY